MFTGKTYGAEHTKKYGHDDAYNSGSAHQQHGAAHGSQSAGASDYGNHGAQVSIFLPYL